MKSLQKLVSVDVYGSCGSLKCSKSKAGGDAGSHCYEMLERKYKFYLSWENALCNDYVTEKFFEVAKYNIIPIVLNGADMEEMAPKHSYISVSDFDNLDDLVAYLHQVDNDDSLFASYFWWREFYSVQDRHTSRHMSWCSLCSQLNGNQVDWNKERLLRLRSTRNQTSNEPVDLFDYWVKQAHCKPFTF